MPDIINMTAIPIPVPDLDVHLLEDEMVIYQSPREMMISLNRSARAIWELCDGRRSLADIAATLARELELEAAADLDKLAQDVQAAVARLQEAGVLELAP